MIDEDGWLGEEGGGIGWLAQGRALSLSLAEEAKGFRQAARLWLQAAWVRHGTG